MRTPHFVNAGTICLLVLLLIVVRCQFEIIRLTISEHAPPSTMWLYVNGSIVAAVAAMAVALLQVYRRTVWIVTVTALTIAGLIVYKLAAT